MIKPLISIIAAIGTNRELGKDNKLIFHIPDDMKRFRQLTSGHAVVMGRKTYESIGKALSNRINIVVTRDKNYRAEDCIISHSLTEAIKIAGQKENPAFAKASAGKEEIFVIGGGEIYRQAIDLADKLYLTIVEGKYEADTYFPDFSRFKKVVFSQKGEYKEYKYTFWEFEE